MTTAIDTNVIVALWDRDPSLPVDLGIADACGRLVARSESMGRPIEPRDAFIVATAEVHGLTLVTRNASDFEATVKAILTPWI
jgi:toxin FitB